jgi:hypothetical protein
LCHEIVINQDLKAEKVKGSEDPQPEEQQHLPQQIPVSLRVAARVPNGFTHYIPTES